MVKALAVIVAACALVGVVSAAEKRQLLQSNYLGYRSRFNVEAPQASRWNAGFATAASGPAQLQEKTGFTGPSPPSAAFGVNPMGGFAEWKDTARFDATLPRYSAVGRASQANTWAADLSAGTTLIPSLASSTKIRPTIPVTFPVFGFGGTVLPTPTYSAVVNPAEGVLGAPKTEVKEDAKEGAKEGAKAAPKKAGRRLMNYGYKDAITARAPSTPRFDYYIRPPPAVSDSALNVRADRTNLDGGYKIPDNLVSVTGKTNAVFGPQRPFPVSGKGSWTVVNLSRGPSTITSSSDSAINWGSGGAVLNNGNPLAITSTSGTVVPNTNFYSGGSFRPQLGDRPDGFIERKTATNIPLPGVGK